ncbi:MAG: diguanylate cyclase, partial [Propionibacteriaceae bacterium]|nr:diguanylate cyclase [Propionibacteriaceae bacterium]
TVSIGATMALPDETADELVERADRLMYASKKSGRNRVTTDLGVQTGKAGRTIVATT